MLVEISDKFPIYGFFVSIILLIGTYQVGNFICKVKTIEKTISNISDIDYLKHSLGIIFLLVTLHPIILFFPYSKEILLLTSIILFILGIYSFFKFSNKIIFCREFLNFKIINFYKDNYLIIFVIIGLILISLAPNTNADSLDYHLRTAKYLAKYGKFPENIFHFHERLSGPGEILSAIGISLGANSFGSLVQSSGLLILYGIFKKISYKNNPQSSLFFLLLITTPVIFFFTSTAKPQFFFICLSSIVFALYFFDKKINKNYNDEIQKLIISLIIIFISFQAKFSFILSSFCFFVLLFFYSINKKNLKEFIVISFFLALIIILPPMIWKLIKFEFNLFEQLISPVPSNLSGMDYFLLYLVRVGGGKSIVSYLIPGSLRELTNTLGLSILFIFLFKIEKNYKTKIIFSLILFFVVVSIFFGQRTERFFFEPLVWLTLSCIFFGVRYRFKFLEYIFRLQIYVALPAIIYCLIGLTSGSISKDLKEKVLTKNANGYSLYKWANSKINKDDVIFTLHRSISYRFDKSIHFEFIGFRSLEGHSREKYLYELAKKKPKYLLTYGTEEMPRVFDEIKDCVGQLLYFKENVGTHAVRNPFIKGNFYNGYIYEFKNQLLPTCVK